MIDKTVSLENAVCLVDSNQTVALGGMTVYRRPVGFVRALIQKRPQPENLTLLAFTAGLAADMLVGAGMVRHTRTCYFGLETFGLAPMFTEAVASGRLEVIEESEASIASGLRAQLGRVGFIPSRAWQGTDMLTVRPDVKSIIDPYSGEKLTAFPAIACDIAIIHVLKSDRFGNSILGGNPTIDHELATVANKVVITCEEIEDQLEGPIDISGQTITAVVHLPGGAWPTSCYPIYPIDGEEILRYIDACNNGLFAEYVGS
jgi:glutaconate CoA-transferase subunit A